MMPSELVYGNYELHEVQTANGYVLDETPVPFAIDGQEEVITVEKIQYCSKGENKCSENRRYIYKSK